MHTLDRRLTSLSPLALLGLLGAIDVVVVLVGWVLYGLPTWPDITPPRILNLLTGEPLIRLVGDDISISKCMLYRGVPLFHLRQAQRWQEAKLDFPGNDDLHATAASTPAGGARRDAGRGESAERDDPCGTILRLYEKSARSVWR